MKAIIERGIPGSGKSTHARSLEGAHIFSADQYFMHAMGYCFDATKLPQAHQYCLRNFVEAVQEVKRHHPVVCDNTNINVWEMAPYVAVAQAYGYDVEIITHLTTPVLGALNNTHNVPLTSCERMYRALEEQNSQIPKWWKHSIIKR